MCKTSLEDCVFCFIKMSNKGAAAAVHMKKYSQLYSSSEKMYGKRIMRRNCYCLLLIFSATQVFHLTLELTFLQNESENERERERNAPEQLQKQKKICVKNQLQSYVITGYNQQREVVSKVLFLYVTTSNTIISFCAFFFLFGMEIRK